MNGAVFWIDFLLAGLCLVWADDFVFRGEMPG
jgi:hypothetical protein